MSLDLEDLRPYFSLTIMRQRKGIAARKTFGSLGRDIARILDLDHPRTSGRARTDDVLEDIPAGKAHVWVVPYVQRVTPGWAVSESSAGLDALHHIVLAFRLGPFVGVFASEEGARRLLTRAPNVAAQSGFESLEFVPAGLLQATLVAGATRTLWMNGTHPRSSIRPDSKVLSGVNLVDALDPLGDQTFYFTSVRSAPTIDGDTIVVGLTPRTSRVWTGATENWEDFAHQAEALLGAVASAADAGQWNDNPLPVLAVPATSLDQVSNAYDMDVPNAETLAIHPDDTTYREAVERWSVGGVFDVAPQKGAALEATARLNGELVARLSIALESTSRGTMKCLVSSLNTSDSESARALVNLCQQPGALRIRYESGHTYSDGRLFLAQHRDVRFDGWQWANFDSIDIRREKPWTQGQPVDFSRIGTCHSLFCWIQSNWPWPSPHLATTSKSVAHGWLLSDDGAGEVADFIHFDPAGDTPSLTLIHIKGSPSAKPGREVVNSAYEVVVGQAVKNIRSIDRQKLAESLQARQGRVTTAAWFEGKYAPDRRQEALEALASLGARCKTRVVVLQPAVRQAAYDRAVDQQRANPKRVPPELARMRQLDSLLLGAQATCRSVGAELTVIGDAA